MKITYTVSVNRHYVKVTAKCDICDFDTECGHAVDYKTQTSDMIDARLNVISLHNTKCNGILTVVVSNDGLYDRFVRSLQ